MRVRDQEAEFREFVAGNSPVLLRTAYLLLHDRDAAEDALQLTLLRVFRHWRRVRLAPEAYTRRVLLNVCRNHWRHVRRHPTQESPDDHEELAASGATESERADQRIVLADALGELPDQQREVLVLRFFAELSVSETAQALRIPEGTVKSTTHRGLRALRVALGEEPQEVFNAQ